MRGLWWRYIDYKSCIVSTVHTEATHCQVQRLSQGIFEQVRTPYMCAGWALEGVIVDTHVYIALKLIYCWISFPSEYFEANVTKYKLFFPDSNISAVFFFGWYNGLALTGGKPFPDPLMSHSWLMRKYIRKPPCGKRAETELCRIN